MSFVCSECIAVVQKQEIEVLEQALMFKNKIKELQTVFTAAD